MHEVHRGAGLRGKLRGRTERDVLRFLRPALGEVPHRIVPGGVQLGRRARNDRVILGMDRDEHPGSGRGAEEPDVVGDPLVEARRDHEDLEARVPVARERGQLSDRGIAWIGDDDVEREVREGALCVAQSALDPRSQRSVLIDHRAHRRHAARDRGARAVLEVVKRRERRRAGEMRVQIDAARKHELSRRVELAWARRHVADRGDAPVLDPDVASASCRVASRRGRRGSLGRSVASAFARARGAASCRR